MITIINERGTGKAQQLLETARKKNAIILTQDKRAFRVKAHSYGYDDISILDYEDLENDDYNLDSPILIHNADKVLDYLFDRYYGLKPIGFSATQEN
jgi:hypothetical protein